MSFWGKWRIVATPDHIEDYPDMLGPAYIDRRVTPDAIDRLGELILTKLRFEDSNVHQGYMRRFIDKVVFAPGTITITGSIKPLELAANDDTNQWAPMVPSSAREWCPADSGLHEQRFGMRLDRDLAIRPQRGIGTPP